MDILLTGANGQLGNEVVRLASEFDVEVLPLARTDLDISQKSAVDAIVDKVRPKVVVNAAAYTAVDKAEADLDQAFAINRDGPGYLAEAAERCGASIIHVSTDYVFDGTKPAPYVEDDPVAPLGAYGESKEAGEQAVRAATDRHVILRTAWVFDPHGANFVKTMLRLGAERDELKVVDDQTGSPTYAADLAKAVLSLASKVKAGNWPAEGYGTFHCAGGGNTTWCGFARKIFELSEDALGRRPNVLAIPTSEFPTPAKRPANSVLDCSKIANIHGISMQPWQGALAEMLERLEQAA